MISKAREKEQLAAIFYTMHYSYACYLERGVSVSIFCRDLYGILGVKDNIKKMYHDKNQGL